MSASMHLAFDPTPSSVEEIVAHLPPSSRAGIEWFPQELRISFIEPLREAPASRFAQVLDEVTVVAVRKLLRFLANLRDLSAILAGDGLVRTFRDDARASSRHRCIAERLEPCDSEASDDLRAAYEWLRAALEATTIAVRDELAYADRVAERAHGMSDAEIRAGLSGEAGSFLRGLLLTIGAMEVVLDPRPLPASTREWCTLALAEMHASANALRALGVRIPTEVRIPGLSPDAWHARRRSSNANRLGARLIELQPRESTLPPGVLDRIVQALQPEQIWLFGSRARGTAAPESDWDLLVVVADSTTKGLDRASIWAELGDLARYRVEVFPIRRSDFEAERHQLGTLAQIAKSEGYLVHDR